MANFFRIGAAGLNWSNVGSWSASSGGVSNGSAQPTSSDNTTFDSNSPATVTVAGTASCNTLTLNKASLVITLNGGSLTASSTTTTSLATVINKTASETFSTNGSSQNTTGDLSGTAKIILTGGTWTVTAGISNIANDLDLQGNITLGNSRYKTGTLTYVSGTITVTSSTINVTAAATLNLNGFTLNNLTIAGNVTLLSNISCSGLLSPSAILTPTASETITTSGGITVAGNTSGNVKIIITGGTWSGGNPIANSIDLQGNVTIANAVRYGDAGILSGGKTLTYVSGTITYGGTFNIQGNCTLNVSGTTFGAVSGITGGTVTLTSDFNVSGLFTAGVNFTFNKTTSEKVSLSGGITVTSGGSVAGTANIYLTGGSWTGVSGTPGSTNYISSPLFVQGNVTVVNSVRVDSNTVTYVSGTVTTTGSTLFIRQAVTLDTNGMSWNNVNFDNASAPTITLNSLLTVTGTLTLALSNSLTFAGTAGFTAATVVCDITSAITITLKNSITYTVTTSLSCYKSRNGSSLLFTSDDGTLKANLVMTNPSTCNCLANFTRINANGGRSITTFNGTVTSCNNIVSYTDYKIVGI